MKLRNKKTGKIRNIKLLDIDDYLIDREVTMFDGEPLSLAELNEGWEDYEEPKSRVVNIWSGDRRKKTIHIKVDSEEYARELCKKLKAWKRLKEKGFKTNKWYYHDILGGDIVIIANFKGHKEDEKDLELLLGHKEI